MEVTSVSLLLNYVTALLVIRHSPILAVTLIVSPDRSAFYKYEQFSLSCEPRTTVCTVRRTTKHVTGEELKRSSRTAFPSDSGEYWCESAEGGSSPRVTISVREAGTLLESPAQHVNEGDAVELRCRYRKTKRDETTSEFNASFFRNGEFIGKKAGGRKTLEKVSTTDQGFYKCKHPTGAESAESWIAVRGTPPPATPPATPPADGEVGEGFLKMSVVGLVVTVLLFIFYTGILLLCIYKYHMITLAQTKA